MSGNLSADGRFSEGIDGVFPGCDIVCRWSVASPRNRLRRTRHQRLKHSPDSLMIKPNVKLALVAVIMVIAAATMFWQKQRAERWMAEAGSLREAVAKAAQVQEENQELHEQLHAATQRAAADAQELARLHALAAAVSQTERLDSKQDTSQPPPQAQPKEEWMDRMYGP